MSKSDSLAALSTLAAADTRHAAPSGVEVLTLFDECGQRLLRYVGSFGLAAHETEDVVQDVFLSLFRHLQLGQSRSNLRGWVFRVAHNLALKERHRRRRVGVWDAAVAARHVDPATNPEEALTEHRRLQRLEAVVRALPARDQACLRLRAEGLRYREIASVLDISLGSVSKSLTRSLAKLGQVDAR